MRALMACLVLVGCGFGRGEPGNGTPKTDTRDVGAFDQVSLEGAMKVEIGVGVSQQVQISGDENIVPLIETSVTGTQLRIRPTKPISPKLPLVATMTTASLTAVNRTGSGFVNVTNVTGDAFAIDATGSGKLHVDGRVKRVAIHISGSGTVDAKALVAEDVKIDVSGSADVVVAANGLLDVNISGSANVRYVGTPREVRKSISGSGSVEPAH